METITYHITTRKEAYAFVIYCFIKEGPFIVLWIFILNFVIAILRGPAFVLYIYLRGPCYCTTCIYWTIHQLGGTLRLYYCTVLDYTPIWGGLAFILYCTILYKTPTWGGPAIVLVTGGGGRLSHFHQLSKLFYSILCPNMKLK